MKQWITWTIMLLFWLNTVRLDPNDPNSNTWLKIHDQGQVCAEFNTLTNLSDTSINNFAQFKNIHWIKNRSFNKTKSLKGKAPKWIFRVIGNQFNYFCSSCWDSFEWHLDNFWSRHFDACNAKSALPWSCVSTAAILHQHIVSVSDAFPAITLPKGRF